MEFLEEWVVLQLEVEVEVEQLEAPQIVLEDEMVDTLF
jgi:hypothetical protein